MCGAEPSPTTLWRRCPRARPPVPSRRHPAPTAAVRAGAGARDWTRPGPAGNFPSPANHSDEDLPAVRKNAVIVGSGIFGVTAALELSARGWDAWLLDQGEAPYPKATSNDANRVVRADYGADAFYVDLGLEAIARWEAWNREWPEPPYHPDGFLLLSVGGLEPGTFEGDSYRLLTERGVPLEAMDAAQVAHRFPAWRPTDYAAAYFNPRAGWAEADRVLRTLVARAEEEGVELVPDGEVARLVEREDRVGGVILATGQTIEADIVLLAAGPWTPRLLPDLADRMWPSGQPILYLMPDDPDAYRAPRFSPWAADIANSGWYGIAGMPDGRVKVAHHGEGVRVDPGADLAVPPSTLPAFREFLRRAIPGLAEAPVVGSRLCVYCDTWDGDFWIDHDPERPGLVVATGGSGHGFKFAPLLGEIIADVVEGRENPRAARFAWRARADRRTEDARSLVELFGDETD